MLRFFFSVSMLFHIRLFSHLCCLFSHSSVVYSQVPANKCNSEERVKKKKVCSSFRFFFHRLCKLFKVLPKSRLGFSLLFCIFYCTNFFALRRKWKMPLELSLEWLREFRANKKVFLSLACYHTKHKSL